MSKKLNIVAVACFAVIAAVFIFDHISMMAFWSDEAASANIIANNFSQLWSKAVADSHGYSISYSLPYFMRL